MAKQQNAKLQKAIPAIIFKPRNYRPRASSDVRFKYPVSITCTYSGEQTVICQVT